MTDHLHPPRGATPALLDRVRALLNKAESTPFEAEAAAFTAKAHELMTRHAIDAAMVADSTSTADLLGVRWVDISLVEPYVDAKALLLHVVASASRCRSVLAPDRRSATVLGVEGDLAAVELLYTSLLLQAHRALGEVSSHAPPGAQVRSRAFRSSFLVGFATRVGERLAEVTRHVVADAEATTGRSVLPVLRDRAAAVDEAMRARFDRLGHRRVGRVSSAAGWHHGTRAADQADLAFGRLAG